MDCKHPKNIDKRPKRRKDKNNPYNLISVGIDTKDPHYYIDFINENGSPICIEITKELFNQFDQWELDDLSFLHEFERHYEHSLLSDQSLNKRAVYKPKTPEEVVLQSVEMKELARAMDTLTAAQYRRLIMYFWDNMSLQEIGAVEGCKYQAIQDSLDRACAKIKKHMKARLV